MLSFIHNLQSLMQIDEDSKTSSFLTLKINLDFEKDLSCFQHYDTECSKNF